MDTPDTYIHDCSLLGLVLTLQSKDKGGDLLNIKTETLNMIIFIKTYM